MKKIIYFLLALIFLTSCGSFGNKNSNVNTNELIFFKGENREVRNKKLIEDLEHFESVMLEKHQKEYRYITDEDFKNRIKELKLNIDNISDSEFVVEIQRIMSYFKEGHLSFLNPSQAILPFYLKTFDDGTYIIGIEKEYEEYNFSKVKSINGIKIKDIREKAKEIISGDNKYNIDYWVDYYITDLDYLVGLKLISNVNEINVVIEKDKKEFNVKFKPKINRDVKTEKSEYSKTEEFKKNKENYKKSILKLIEKSSGKEREKLENDLKKIDNLEFVTCNYIGKSFLEIDNIPYKMNPTQSYTFETFPKSNAMVLHYNKCFSEEHKPFDKFSAEFFNYIRDNKGLLKINNIIIDLRYNEGGSETVFLSFLDELEKYEKENKNLKIHILVGRNTFSAGTSVVYSLKKKFRDATIYGEPLAGGIYSSGNVTQDILPNSKLIFSYGQSFFDKTKGNKNLFTEKEIKENVLIPNEILKPTIKDYIDNRDYVLEEILNRMKK